MQRFLFSLFTSNDAEPAAGADVAAGLPVEIGSVELQKVAGGLGPAGTWVSETTLVKGPAGTW